MGRKESLRRWALAGTGALLAFAVVGPSTAGGLDPATMKPEEIKALEQRLTDAGCYKGAIDGQTSGALDDAIKACPDQRPFLRIETGMHTAPIRRIGVDPACRSLATASDDKTLRLWSLPDGKLKRIVRLPIGEGNAGKLFATALSPDGRWLAAGGWGDGPGVSSLTSLICPTASSGGFLWVATSSISRSPPTGGASPSGLEETTASACWTPLPGRS